MDDSKPNRADLEKVIAKVRKLFALGTSPNEHEAASAVAKAQALLEEYDLTMESVEDLKSDKRTSIRRGETFDQSLSTDGKPDGWKKDLFYSVADSFDCFTAFEVVYETTPSGKERSKSLGKFIGFAHDVEMAGYALSFLIHEIERLAQGYADSLWSEIRQYRDHNGLTQHDAESEYVKRTGRHPLKAKLYFIKGAAESVSRNLRAGHYKRRQEASSNPHAIVLRNKKAAVEDFLWMEQYGRTKSEQYALWAAAAEARKKDSPVVLERAETPAQAKARREREERDWARRWQQEKNRQARAEAAMDKRAYRAGADAGANIKLNPGLGE